MNIEGFVKNNILELSDLDFKTIRDFTNDFDVPLFKRMHFGSAGNGGGLMWPTIDTHIIRSISDLELNKLCHYPEAIPSLRGISVRGLRVMVLGSSAPWLELWLLREGALSVTTIEYREIDWTISGGFSKSWSAVTYANVLNGALDGCKFDMLISYSSIEHSGLGRYGDEIDPNGDLKTLALLRENLDEPSKVLLAIPLGEDSILFNRHRVYGRRRLASVCNVLRRSNVTVIAPEYGYLDFNDNHHEFSIDDLLSISPGSDGVQRLVEFT